MRKRCVLFLSLLLAALPLHAAEPAFADVLTGKATPLTIVAKELTPEWLCLNIAGNPSLELMRVYGGHSRPTRPITYFTRGITVAAGAESFLIAYQVPPPEAPQGPRSYDEEPGDEPTLEQFLAGRLPADTALSLVLLNVREVSAITNIRLFDPKKELVTAEELKAAEQKLAEEMKRTGNTRSLNNLRQISIAIAIYAQDHDEILPEAATVWQDIRLDKKTMVHPVTNEQYVYNTVIAGKGIGAIEDPVATVLVYEANPALDDGLRGVAFMDGHTERVTAERWQQLKQANKIP